jgi:Rieske Fe-S protein
MEIPLARYPELEEEGGVVKILSADGGVFFLRRTASGHVCHSALCTHQSCVVEAFPRGYECPCHGSTYDAAGRNTGGPAPRPLPAYPSWREGDVVIVDLRGEDATTPREPTQGGKS